MLAAPLTPTNRNHMPKIYREDAEQKAVIQWADMTRNPDAPGIKIGTDLFAIPNGGARSRIEAARLIGLGVRPGVSDLFLSYPMGGYHGLFIEMKAPKPHSSTTSKVQNQFIDRKIACGYRAQVCKGFDEASKAILDYLTL